MGAIKLIKNLPHKLELLDLSYNSRLGVDLYKMLGEEVLDNDTFSEIHTLELEGNNMKDAGAELITKATEYC